MINLNGFDASQVDPAFGFEALPPADYVGMITDSETKVTRNGDGSYLQLTWEVMDGPYKGRKLWTRLNLENRSEKVVAFARAELSAVCRAVGVLKPKDTIDLHNLPAILTVTCQKRADTGETVNKIARYRKKDESGESSHGTTDAAPWKRP
ncbi:MAG: DUF669 domain-containing protein [Candidatus Eisenbacteria bacterium]